MESLTKREQPDRSKINVHQPDELKAWARALNVTRKELLAAGGGPPTSKQERSGIRRKGHRMGQRSKPSSGASAGEPNRRRAPGKGQGYETEVPEDKSYRWNLD